ncbi:MAG TPA: hypothetical protein PKA77_01335 [Chitinophagaceae bacterium]|jgi:hypothetical protein|nr:hypothetical protein [Chitinophagaceae bacterium]
MKRVTLLIVAATFSANCFCQKLFTLNLLDSVFVQNQPVFDLGFPNDVNGVIKKTSVKKWNNQLGEKFAVKRYSDKNGTLVKTKLYYSKLDARNFQSFYSKKENMLIGAVYSSNGDSKEDVKFDGIPYPGSMLMGIAISTVNAKDNLFISYIENDTLFKFNKIISRTQFVVSVCDSHFIPQYVVMSCEGEGTKGNIIDLKRSVMITLDKDLVFSLQLNCNSLKLLFDEYKNTNVKVDDLLKLNFLSFGEYLLSEGICKNSF